MLETSGRGQLLLSCLLTKLPEASGQEAKRMPDEKHLWPKVEGSFSSSIKKKKHMQNCSLPFLPCIPQNKAQF